MSCAVDFRWIQRTRRSNIGQNFTNEDQRQKSHWIGTNSSISVHAHRQSHDLNWTQLVVSRESGQWFFRVSHPVFASIDGNCSARIHSTTSFNWSSHIDTDERRFCASQESSQIVTKKVQQGQLVLLLPLFLYYVQLNRVVVKCFLLSVFRTFSFMCTQTRTNTRLINVVIFFLRSFSLSLSLCICFSPLTYYKYPSATN